MSSIDTRIVEMKFDNSQFEAGVRQTLGSIDALNKGLKFDGASKGLTDLNAAGKNVNLSHIGSAVESINQKFSALSVAAIAAFGTIVSKATSAGLSLAKSFTVQPILEGFSEYETKLGSIQTILANTKASGATLKDVSGTLKELNTYSDQTIYNFGEMAKNIGTFTAAGVDLKTATGSIKGIANLAALSGSNSQQASTAMYQLSQAISSGKVSLQDWNSVVNAGMGGTVFQRALAQTAEKMGTLDKGAVKLTGKMKNATINGKSFRESITAKPGEQSWLTSDVLTKTLQQFTGDMTDAQLKAEGFSAAQIKAIQDQAQTAKNAATEVKTATQLMGTLKEAAGSGWAESFELIIGDFEEAKKLWTNVNDVFGGFIQSSADGRNKVLADWKALGGRTALIDGIKNAFTALMSVVKPIKDAFRQIFPATTGKQLADMTKTFRDFTERLKMGGESADRLKRTFAGVFAIFGIGWEIIKQVAKVFFDLFGQVNSGSGGFLKVTASVGDFLVALHRAIKNGEGLTKFFKGLTAVLKAPIKIIQSIAKAFGSLFEGLDFSKLDGVEGKFKPFAALGTLVSQVWEKVVRGIDNVVSAFSGMADQFGGSGDLFKNIFGDINFDHILKMIQTVLLGGILVLFKQFVGSFSDGVDVIGGWKETLTGPFDAMTDTLGAMQNTLRAATLLAIAAAVALLAASAVALSKIDADGLKRALAALAGLFTQLAIAMAVFQKIDIKGGMAQLILVAIALRILTSAVVDMAELDWNGLAKGLVGTAVLLGALAATAQLMPDEKKMIASSIGLVIMAGAIKLLVSSVKDLAEMSWEDMARGLVGVGALLASLAIFTKLVETGKSGMIQGVGLILLATGIKILAGAVTDFAKMSWEEVGRGLAAMAGGLGLMGAALMLIPPSSIFSAAAILVVASSLGLIGDAMAKMGGMEWEAIARGLVAMGGALAIIGIALALLPPTTLFSAAAIFVVASSLGLIASALGTMGGMSWEEIAKGLIVLAGSLGIIALAMAGMTTAIFGAAALVVVAGALAILAPILLLFGGMSWEEIGKGLLMLAGALAVIGIAGLLITPVIPSLLGLGIAVGLLGVGMALAGAGVLAFALGLTALAAAGAAGVTAIVAIVSGLIGLLPTVMAAIGKAIIAFAKTIAAAGPAITMAITTVLMALMNSIIRLTPKIAQTMLVLLNNLLRVIQAAVPRLVQAGSNIIASILNGFAANMNRIITAATNLIVAFIRGIQNNMPRVLDAGAKLIIAFVNGLANTIRSNQAQMNAAGRNLATAIVQGMASGISGGLSIVTNAARRLAQSALSAARGVLRVNSPSKAFAELGAFSAQGFVVGLDGGKAAIVKSVKDLQKMIQAAQKKAAGDVKALEAKLKKMNADRYKTKKERAAIKATTKALVQARSELAKSNKAMTISKTFGDEVKTLSKLSDKADAVAKKIEDANKKLADATKVRDDYAKSVHERYGDLPDFGKDTKLTNYVAEMEKQIANTEIFRAQLLQLRKMGLNDDMYEELVAKGFDAMPFVEQILNGGQASVTQLNDLGKSLDKQSRLLSVSTSTALYKAGVDSARGLVAGLKKEQANIEKQMDVIAASMVKAIKKALGIKSPSREFMKVGDWSVKGLAKGLEDSSSVVKSAEKVGNNAIDAMRKTLRGLPDALSDNMDTNPTIRPILDLTDIKKNAGKVGSMLAVNPLDVGTAYNTARNAALEYRSVRFAQAEADESLQTGDNFTFVQNNTSPKALSSAEIYRQTSNQISKAKGALKTR